MSGPRWIIRSLAVIAVAVAIASAVSWSVDRGYFYDLLAPSLRDDPQYSLTKALMRERNDRNFDVLTIGSAQHVDKISAALAPCVRNLQISLPTYHYAELRRTIQTLQPFRFDYLFIENHPAFWSNLLVAQPVTQKLDAWHSFRRRQQPSQLRSDLRTAFTLIADAVRPDAPVNTLNAKQLALTYSKARYHENLKRWDHKGVVRSLLKRVDHRQIYWFMSFAKGPYEDSNAQLRTSLENRFAQKEFDEALGHLYPLDSHREVTDRVSKQVCID